MALLLAGPARAESSAAGVPALPVPAESATPLHALPEGQLPADVPARDAATGAVVPSASRDPIVTDPPGRALWHAKDGGRARLWVPVLEVPSINLVFWSIDKAVGADYANVTPAIIGQHLFHGPWEWDHDVYFLNEFGHPYQGSLTFTAARSAGLDFWASVPFALAGSALWEIAGEKEAPSKNDIITTPTGGVMLGEVLHRVSLLVLDEGQPSPLRDLLSIAVEPVGGLNRYLFGRPAHDFFRRPPYYASFNLGVATNVNNYVDIDGVHRPSNNGPQLHLAVDLIYGLPGDPEWTFRQPFDHFVFSSELGISRDFYGALFMRGLIAGSSYDWGQLRGLWGLFGGYDFANPSTLRVSSVNLGLGSSAQFPMRQGVYLVPTAIVSGIPFGAGGGLESPSSERDYHYGFGAQELLELELVRRGVGRMGITERGYVISGQFLGEGWESITYLTATSELMIVDNAGLGAEAFIADRTASFGGANPRVHERALQLRVYVTLFTGDGFGALLGTLPAPMQ